jgi:hypothetical protein
MDEPLQASESFNRDKLYLFRCRPYNIILKQLEKVKELKLFQSSSLQRGGIYNENSQIRIGSFSCHCLGGGTGFQCLRN